MIMGSFFLAVLLRQKSIYIDIKAWLLCHISANDTLIDFKSLKLDTFTVTQEQSLKIRVSDVRSYGKKGVRRAKKLP